MSFTAIITADVSGLERGVQEAQKRIDGLQKSIDSRLTTIGNSFTNAGKKVGLLSAAIGAVGVKAFDMAADLTDAIGATEQIFKGSADIVQDWADSLSTSYGIAKKEAIGYANLMGSMLINIGRLTEEEAGKQAAKLIELAGDLTAMYGGNVQDAIRALTGALKGNNTMLDNYGLAVNEALVKQRALELGVSDGTGELSLQARQLATLSLIWEQTAAVQGQAAREADGASGSMRTLKAEITNLTTSLGELLLPVITPVINKITEIVRAIGEMPPQMKQAIVAIAGIAAALGPAMLALGGLLKMLPMLGAAFTAMTSPVGIAVGAIAGAAALIITNWDKIKEYFTSGGGAELFQSVKELALNLKEAISFIFNDIKIAVTKIWDAIGGDVSRIFGELIDIVVSGLKFVIDTVNNVAELFGNIIEGDFKGALNKLKDLFVSAFMYIGKVVSTVLSEIVRGVSWLLDAVGLDKWANSVSGFADKMANSFNTTTKEVDNASTSAKEYSDKISDVGKDTEVLTGKNELLTSSLSKTSDAFMRLVGDGSDLRDIVSRTSAEIDKLNERLLGLQTGAITVKNVKSEIEKVEKEISELTAALDTLTGGRELNLDLNVSGMEAWTGSDMFKSMKDAKIQLPAVDDKLLMDSIEKSKNDFAIGIADLSDVAANGISDFAAAVGTAFATGDWDVMGADMIGALGNLAQQFGRMLIEMGVAAIALKKLITNPLTAIAAGAALIALGAAATAKANKMVENATGGGSAGNYSSGGGGATVVTPAQSEYRGAYSDDFKVEFKIGANELVGVLDTAEQRRKRL